MYRFADHVRPRTNGQSQPLSIYPLRFRMESSVLAVPVQQISLLACALTWVGCDDWRLWVPSFSSAGHLYSSLYDSSSAFAGGEVTAVDAWPTTTVGEFKRLVTEALRKDDDELLRRVTVVDLLLDERPLSDDSATIAECGLSNGKAVLAIFKQRCVECVRWQDAKEDLTVADNPVRLIIPDGTTEVPSLAFRACVSIQSVRIPSSVTSIGIAAFSFCTSLAHLTIPESVTSLERKAFKDCSSLAILTIPYSVTSIAEGAFCGCSSLISVSLPDSVRSIGERAFCDCGSLANLTIPETVTRIGDYAFRDCDSLRSLTIPESVASIGQEAFYGCSSLTSLKIANLVISVGDSAFSECSSLKHLTIPLSLPLHLSASTGGMRSGMDLTCFVPRAWQAECMVLGSN